MARNSWYEKKEEAYLMRRARELKLPQLSYGGRRAIYEQIARELHRRFGARRSWQGIQQRVRLLLKSF